MKLELIAKEIIRPVSPNHLPNLHLSLFDQFVPSTYVSAIFFYDDQGNQEETIVQTLKKSLCQTLSVFYPLAGMIKEGVIVDCNDEGALFTEARADILLSDFLRNPSDADLVHKLIVSPEPADPETWPLLHVKVIFFREKGFAVSVSVSHKICDAASLSTFVYSWTKAANGHGDDKVNPEFAASVFYPPADISTEFPPLLVNQEKSKTKRFVFNGLMIEKLKSRASCSKRVPKATRVESITALLLRCALKARGSKTDEVREYAISQTMDLRHRVPFSLLPPKAIGNFFFLSLMKESSKSEIEIRDIVSKLHNTKEELNELIRDDTTSSFGADARDRITSAMLRWLCEVSSEVEMYTVSSWCRMSFYKADFGWGVPVWVAPGSVTKTQVVLMDAKDGEGVEAWVTLPETDMVAFEHDEMLLVYATPTPSILI